MEAIYRYNMNKSLDIINEIQCLMFELDEERRKPNGIRSVREYELMNQIFLKKFELSSVYND